MVNGESSFCAICANADFRSVPRVSHASVPRIGLQSVNQDGTKKKCRTSYWPHKFTTRIGDIRWLARHTERFQYHPRSVGQVIVSPTSLDCYSKPSPRSISVCVRARVTDG